MCSIFEMDTLNTARLAWNAGPSGAETMLYVSYIIVYAWVLIKGCLWLIL